MQVAMELFQAVMMTYMVATVSEAVVAADVIHPDKKAMHMVDLAATAM